MPNSGYNVKEMALRFASFEADTEEVTWFQVNEASDVIYHVLLAKRIKLQRFNVTCFVFLIQASKLNFISILFMNLCPSQHVLKTFCHTISSQLSGNTSLRL